jgi:hypothetical protein
MTSSKVLFSLLRTAPRLSRTCATATTSQKDHVQLRDFKYALTKCGGGTAVDKRFANLKVRDRDRPLVFIFGWAGASAKNLDKYASVYRRAGCDTLSYFLPTRFIVECTGDVPIVARRILEIVRLQGMMDRPVFFHNLSDTGRISE